jgi:type IV conjugative transfer system coupling protein TraD
MSRPRKSAFAAWLRGGQTLSHTYDMALEVLGRLVVITALWGVVCFFSVNRFASEREQVYGLLSLQAGLLEWIGPPAPQELRFPDLAGRDQTHPVEEVESIAWMAPYAQAYRARVHAGALIFLIGILVIGIVSAAWFLEFGREKLKTRQVRGQRVERLSVLISEVERFNSQEARRRRTWHLPAKLIGAPYPFETELEHTLIVGSPGSGKSRAIHDLIESIRARGDRAIIYDAELDFIRTWYDPATDIILNPFDARSPAWSPYFDAVDLPDFEKLAHSLYKSPKSGDPYWTDVARQLFAWTAYVLRQRDRDVSLEALLRVLFGSTEKLAEVLVGTPAHKHVKDGPGPRVGSLESVLVEGVTPLVYLLGGSGRFSIKDWVNAPGRAGGFLFLSAPETHIDSLRPLIGFWSELVVGALLSRHETSRLPTWVILDEFASLGRIDKLADGPQRLRKYGGAIVLGLQQVSQIQEIYGQDRARTIMGQCATKLILRAQDPETARFMSDQLGRRLVRRMDESTSYGANSLRDGVAIAPREAFEPVALAEDILNLPKFQGYLRLSNAREHVAFPIAPVRFSYGERAQVAEGFVAVEGPDPIERFLAAVRPGAVRPAEGLFGDGGLSARPGPTRAAPKAKARSAGRAGRQGADRQRTLFDEVKASRPATPTAPVSDLFLDLPER